jgi:ABC-type multidrug transport system fused ATPase/permease subunit
MNTEKLSDLFTNILKVWSSIGQELKTKALYLLLLILLGSILEVISILALFPLLTLMTNNNKNLIPPLINNQAILNLSTYVDLPLLLVTVFILIVTLTAFSRLLIIRLSSNFAFKIGHELGVQMFRKTILQPYHKHLENNAADIIDTIYSKITSVVYFVILPIFLMISGVSMSLIMILALLVLSPANAMYILFIFIILYAFMILLVKKKLKANSHLVVTNGKKLNILMQDALGAIRDVIINNSHNYFHQNFDKISGKIRKSQADSNFIGQFPKNILEALGLVGISVVAFFSQENGNFISAIPLLGVIALAAQRLLPALQQVYWSWSSLQSHISELVSVNELLQQQIGVELIPNKNNNIKLEQIELVDINYAYEKNNKEVFKNVNLQIKFGEKIGIVGNSGVGKSTLLDIIATLLKPTSGALLINKESLSCDRYYDWRNSLAYVSQNIFLSDSTIKENIAFGIDKQDINLANIERAAKIASIDEFINSLPNGYDETVGERGVHLSGGQRQRIGIARALYKNANLLILDEATSALDAETESNFIELLELLTGQITIVVVAHRLTSLVGCDRIYRLTKEGLVRNYI